MLSPSQKYRDELNTIHQAFEYELIVDVENHEFFAAQEPHDSGHLQNRSMIDALGVNRGLDINSVTMTAETNLALLDGTATFENNDIPFQGFASLYMSDEWGSVSGLTPIYSIFMHHGEQLFELPGIEIIFDPLNNDYCTEFYISYYNGSDMVKQIHVTDNDSPHYKSHEPSGVINRIDLHFIKTFNPHRRVRVFNVIFGLSETFTGDGINGITSVTQEHDISPIMSAIPKDELSVTILDTEQRFNKENPDGLWKYLIAGKEMKFNYFLPFPDGTREKVPGGIKYLKNPPTTAGTNLIKFEGTGFIQSQTQNYEYGKYYPNGIDFYTLFYNVLTSFPNLPRDDGYPKIIIDYKLSEYKCYVPLPIKPGVEIIQMLCASVGRIVFEDSDGWIHIKENNSIIGDYNLGLQNAFDYPEYQPEIPPLKDIIIEESTTTLEQDVELFYGTQTAPKGTNTIQIPYDMSANHSYMTYVSVGGTNITNIEFYANKCFLTISSNGGTITISITGDRIKVAKTQRRYYINPTGEDCTVSLAPVSDIYVSDMLSRFYAKYLQESKRYKYNFSADPSRRANDVLKFDTRFAQNISAMILSSKFTSDGHRGELTLKNYFSPDTNLLTGMHRTGNDWFNQFIGRWTTHG